MAWSTPRTWVASEVVTAAIMNAHVRDQFQILKVTRDDAGRLIDLSSTTLASLSPANLPELATVAGGNDFTAGKKRLVGTSRLVVPVGVNKYHDLGGGLRRGVWVEGDFLHHIASNQSTEWRYLGEYVSTPAGASPGSLWAEGDFLHYVDADGDERRCQSLNATGHNDAAADPGSLWIETYQHIIREAGSVEKPIHADVSHSDGVQHNDAAHVDTPHSDTAHNDVPFSDNHNDVAHDDTAHADHSDHVDHDDDPVHSDTTPHADQPHDDSPHQDHQDGSHGDSPHVDSAHVDSAHQDHSDHGDAAFVDQPTVVP